MSWEWRIFVAGVVSLHIGKVCRFLWDMKNGTCSISIVNSWSSVNQLNTFAIMQPDIPDNTFQTSGIIIHHYITWNNANLPSLCSRLIHLRIITSVVSKISILDESENYAFCITSSSPESHWANSWNGGAEFRQFARYLFDLVIFHRLRPSYLNGCFLEE